VVQPRLYSRKVLWEVPIFILIVSTVYLKVLVWGSIKMATPLCPEFQMTPHLSEHLWCILKTRHQETAQSGPPVIGGNGITQGSVVAICGDGKTIASGRSGDNSNVGAVWIFVVNATGSWNQQGSKLAGTGYTKSEPFQGSSVSLSYDGGILVSAAPIDGPSFSEQGSIFIFIRNSITKLWNPAPGVQPLMVTARFTDLC